MSRWPTVRFVAFTQLRGLGRLMTLGLSGEPAGADAGGFIGRTGRELPVRTPALPEAASTLGRRNSYSAWFQPARLIGRT